MDAQKRAVALGYNRTDDNAPRVLASGKGLMAEKIIEIAQGEGIFIQEDKDLVHLLSKIEVGTEIPESLYQAVAEVLSFVYEINKGYPKRK